MLFYYLSLVHVHFLFGDELNHHFVKKEKKKGGLGGGGAKKKKLRIFFGKKGQ